MKTVKSFIPTEDHGNNFVTFDLFPWYTLKEEQETIEKTGSFDDTKQLSMGSGRKYGPVGNGGILAVAADRKRHFSRGK